jgi:hypothetical protein
MLLSTPLSAPVDRMNRTRMLCVAWSDLCRVVRRPRLACLPQTLATTIALFKSATRFFINATEGRAEKAMIGRRTGAKAQLRNRLPAGFTSSTGSRAIARLGAVRMAVDARVQSDGAFVVSASMSLLAAGLLMAYAGANAGQAAPPR